LGEGHNLVLPHKEKSVSDDFEQEEYFFLANAVGEFDKRLLTVKGWGVSLSLVAVGLGFQYRVRVLSGCCDQ
jgi:hypothetical protein